ncbi:PAP2 superfamily protein [Planctomycetes bacterium Pan216]|uniref:PAP2 superfamily protein n=1 Tax=Kolteria novifilia TaxID=2527975 RepID=A0A518B699_9BACT|nr:PAP2 superfamily protein [Planctomycetes bacterium Pan216]
MTPPVGRELPTRDSRIVLLLVCLAVLIAPWSTSVAEEIVDWEEVPVVDEPSAEWLPTCPSPRLRDDLRAYPHSLWEDTKSIVTLKNGLLLGAGGGLAAYSANNWDAEVRQNTADHARRWGGFNNVFDVIGHPGTQAGIGATLYGTSLITDNVPQHEFSCAWLSSLIITDASVAVLKSAWNTRRPDGGSGGFPSGHTASSFASAAVIEEYHGPWIGLGAYTVAGLVSWQRIDGRKHDLSDVIFGAVLGYVVGKSVAKGHLQRHESLCLQPYVDHEQGVSGLAIEGRF